MCQVGFWAPHGAELPFQPHSEALAFLPVARTSSASEVPLSLSTSVTAGPSCVASGCTLWSQRLASQTPMPPSNSTCSSRDPETPKKGLQLLRIVQAQSQSPPEAFPGSGLLRATVPVRVDSGQGLEGGLLGARGAAGWEHFPNLCCPRAVSRERLSAKKNFNLCPPSALGPQCQGWADFYHFKPHLCLSGSYCLGRCA